MEVSTELDPIERRALASVTRSGRGFRLTVAVLGSLVLWALYAYITQLRHGLAVTGLNRPVYWGLYITDLVFFLGIGMAGTLVSAVLRACRVEWRRPVTRVAEAIRSE